MLASRLVLGGRYELAERVGAGGFSEVWRATDLVLARPVAVKLPYPGFTQDDEALARFRAEARNAGRLSHENVARVYDYGEPDPPHPPFLVLELIDGPPLSVLLRDGPLAPEPRRPAAGPGRRRAGRRAPGRADPPGHQAGQPDDRPRRHREGHRLRHLVRGRVRPADRHRADLRHPGLPRAGTGRRGVGDRRGRPVLARHRRLPVPHRGAPVHRRPAGPGACAPGPPAAAAARLGPGRPGRPDPGPDRQGPRGPPGQRRRGRPARRRAGRPARLSRAARPAAVQCPPRRRPCLLSRPARRQPPGPEAPPAAGPHWAAAGADDQPTLRQPQPGRAGPRRRSWALAAALATAALAGGIFLASQAGPMPTPPAVAGPSATHRPPIPGCGSSTCTAAR